MFLAAAVSSCLVGGYWSFKYDNIMHSYCHSRPLSNPRFIRRHVCDILFFLPGLLAIFRHSKDNQSQSTTYNYEILSSRLVLSCNFCSHLCHPGQNWSLRHNYGTNCWLGTENAKLYLFCCPLPHCCSTIFLLLSEQQ